VLSWNLAQEVKIRALGDNLFIMKFSCLGDWEKVTEGGPWVFRGHAVLFAPYDGFTKPSTIELNHLSLWVQIHDLPDGFKGMLKSLASRVGEFVSTEPPSFDFAGNFYRIRVKIDVRKQLKKWSQLLEVGKERFFSLNTKNCRIGARFVVCSATLAKNMVMVCMLQSPEALVLKDLRATWSIRQGGRQDRGGCGNAGRGEDGVM
jgi:hypothetical protein